MNPQDVLPKYGLAAALSTRAAGASRSCAPRTPAEIEITGQSSAGITHTANIAFQIFDEFECQVDISQLFTSRVDNPCLMIGVGCVHESNFQCSAICPEFRIVDHRAFAARACCALGAGIRRVLVDGGDVSRLVVRPLNQLAIQKFFHYLLLP